jgi:formylglycine-generating enzyme required for sulfatase activity
MIPVRCGHCGKELKVKDELAGKKVKCPGCRKPVAVPQPAASISPPPSSRAEPARPPAGADERTLPPKKPDATNSLADAEGHTDLGGGRKGDATQGMPGTGVELTEFLAPAEQPDEIGRLGGYRVLKVLGSGGMGVVFQAEDPQLRRLVALKAMLPGLATSGTAKERFFREARSAAALKHPHIVTIHQVGEDRGAPFLAMEFLEGEPLDARLKRQKKLPPADILHIGIQVAAGLAAAHAKGLIHRDIKPANIWLESVASSPSSVGVPPSGGGKPARAGTPTDHGLRTTDSVVKILDFGLARAAGDDSHLTQTGAIIGTPAYMAPEQAEGKACDHRSDLFSLGCVLYRMCTGELPFKGDSTLATLSALAMSEPEPPSELDADVPEALSDLVMKLLAKKPGRRPESAQAVMQALQQIQAEQTAEMTIGQKTGHAKGEATKARTRSSRIKRRSRTPWLVGGGVLGLCLLVVLLILVLRPRSNEPGPPDPNKLEALTPTFTNSLGIEFVLVPRGKSWLGGGSDNPGTKEVDILHDFYLGKYEVTQEEWEKVMRSEPSHFSRRGLGDDAVKGVSDSDLKRFPVENVSWDDCQMFIKRVNEQTKESDWVYRLPTEVEWEYACRGGPMKDNSESAFNFYLEKPGNQLLPDQANFDALKRTCKVGSYQPNRLGLYDIHGNVWEWCQDERKDGQGASQRVSRGGSWGGVGTSNCRAAIPLTRPPSHRFNALGLRLARVPVGKEIVKVPVEKPAVEANLPAQFKNSLGIEFVLVPKGKSWLGGGEGKPGTKEVEITHDFYLGKYEVTQEEWQKVMGVNPSFFKAVPGVAEKDQKRFSVEQVSWDDCQLFIKRVNEQAKETGWVYRLPTEAEWEYACRGGSMKDASEGAFDFYLEKPAKQLSLEQANVERGKAGTCKVGTYRPNRLGLYDMHGNVWEWCQDELKDDRGASRGVSRGGGWGHDAGYCRAAYRRTTDPPSHRGHDLGLRLARVPVGKETVKIAPEEKKPPVEAELLAFKNSLGMEFALIPKGKSWLGGGGGKPGTKEVEVLHDFYLGKYEVTQEEWQKVMEANPSHFKAVGGVAKEDQRRFPVEQVSWEDAQIFIKRVNEQTKEAGWVYRLPTEVEWEYACRDGPMKDKSESAFHYYLEKPANQLLPNQANFEHGKGLKRTCKVGSYKPNRLGLYDMHGNVWEWCQDESKKDNEASWRVLRGGGWVEDAGLSLAAHRNTNPPAVRYNNLGLRLARVPAGK